MNRLIAKQLRSYPKLEKAARIAYYEPKPGNQVHMDTMFWKESGLTGNANPIPILVIVDVATRFTKLYIQRTKNDRVLESFKDFTKELRKKFRNVATSTVLVTDGAKELAKPFENLDNVYHKQSTGINKAVLAEAKIRQIRQILRSVELELNMNNLEKDLEQRIDREALEKICSLVEQKVNEKAKQQPKPKTPTRPPRQLALGAPVFALNLEKYYPHQLKDVLRKKSYDGNWYTEPFYVSKRVTFGGITKYEITAYIDHRTVKYWFYEDMLQPIDPKASARYIAKYVEYFQKREGDPSFL